MKTPRGFRFAGVNVGVKAVRKDLALILSDVPCNAAACVTVNKAKAAPLLGMSYKTLQYRLEKFGIGRPE